ncbi:MAG: PAS domain-containing hybrid sensor histidine kinase/response regulator, partial [Calditrichaeota bacterium]
FENTGEVVFACDSQGRLVEINPAALQVFGCDRPEELIGKHLGRDLFLDPQDYQQIHQSLQTEGAVHNREIQVRDLRGEPRTLRISATALRDQKGNLQGFSGLMRDETEIRRLEEQFFQAQKMESIALLAGGVAHDFNNILGGILGYASFLKMKLPSDSPLHPYLDTIENGARRGAELTAQLLAFSRKSQGRSRPVQLNRVVREAHKLLRSTIDRAISVQLNLEEPLPTIEADETQLHQVIMNLCLNARDAIPDPEKGRIAIATRQVTLTGADQLKHIHARPGRYVVLEVSDNGIGMDEQTRQRIFEPFFTTKGKGKGTGLGLAMVYGVAKHLRGFVVVDSNPGQGSRFSVYFPASHKQECQASEKSSGNLRGSESILVVDDEAPIRELFQAVLEEHGYRVQLAQDGQEALELLSNPSYRFDLIVLDMIMPRLGGRALLERLSRNNGHHRVLISSGYSNQMENLESLIKGPIAFLRKPFRVNQLLQLVRELLNKPLPA